jgi:cyclic pyranopterin phosphate synthase
MERDEILTFEEIHRIVGLFTECGISKVRLTGGEPLVRKNIVQLVRQLAAIAGIEDLALTTNGVLLEPMADVLKAAGLSRVNISVDSTERQNYQCITGFDFLEKVTKGIYRAIEVGLMPVKINMVVLRRINEQDVAALAQLSVEMPLTVRFIEYCPTNKNTSADSFFVPNNHVRRIIESKFGSLTAAMMANANGPAVYFKIKGAAGTIGFISGRTTYFCHRCSRLRLTSDGKVSPCLYSAQNYDLKKPVRNSAGDEQILALLKKIIAEKHRYTKFSSFTEDFSMQRIGG